MYTPEFPGQGTCTPILDPVLRTGQIVFALTQRLDANSHFTQDCSDGIWPDWLACPKNDGIGAVILQEEIHFLTKTR